MRKFREAYKEEVNCIQGIRIDAQAVGDEVHHRRMEKRRRQKFAVRAASAAVLFLMCGVGTVTAVNYQRSIFKVTENGFTAVSEKAQVLEEEPGADAGNTGNSAEDLQGIPPMKAVYQGEDAGEQDEIAECEAMKCQLVEYTSIEEFREKEEITIAIPDLALLGDAPVFERVSIFEDMERVMVLVNFGESSFYMSQSDYRGVEAYASATSYMGESVNERHLTGKQGLDYLLFDTVEDGELISTHAVISVNGRDLAFDFSGYEEETIESILTKLDLSIYFKDE